MYSSNLKGFEWFREYAVKFNQDENWPGFNGTELPYMSSKK